MEARFRINRCSLGSTTSMKRAMNLTRLALLSLITAGAAACAKPPLPAEPPPAVAQTIEITKPDYSRFEERYREENDRICKRMHGLPCHAMPHLMGPMNATSAEERLACVNGIVAVYVSGAWVPDLKYRDPKSGSRYGDGCIAISL